MPRFGMLHGMTAIAHSVCLDGLQPGHVLVEAEVARGVPSFTIVGLGDAAVQEARERVGSAVRNAGYAFPLTRKVVNLAPSGTRKAGSHYDLAIAASLLAAAGSIAPPPPGTALFGELGLDGTLRPIRGVLPLALGARAIGMRRVIVPAANAAEAALCTGVDVCVATDLRQAVTSWGGGRALPVATRAAAVPLHEVEVDLADVRGQEGAKRAIEIAAAGSHALLLCGPPGSGKSVLAAALPGLLPPLEEAERLLATQLHSLAGTLSPQHPVVAWPPFRRPHHGASGPSLLGTASPARPGELSLAHHGVLFLDELPLLTREALDALREPLEEGWVRVSRARRSVRYPAEVLFVGAMNPCPCGPPASGCACAPGAVRRYRGRIPGPVLDRIDLHVELRAIDPAALLSAGEGERTATVAARVQAARAYRTRRGQRALNARLPFTELEDACRTDATGRALLSSAAARLGLTARGVHRTLRVARTIADLAEEPRVGAAAVSEAIQFRAGGTF